MRWFLGLWRKYKFGMSHNYYPIRAYGFFGEREPTTPEDIHCPVCGYYCLGEGGVGCIDKPSLCDKVN